MNVVREKVILFVITNNFQPFLLEGGGLGFRGPGARGLVHCEYTLFTLHIIKYVLLLTKWFWTCEHEELYKS